MKISFHPDVLKQLQRLPRAELEAALQVVIGLSNDPRPAKAKKLVGSQRDWRVRFGHYRVVYAIDDTAGEITVFNVAKRSDAYR
ncbi:type II toxin-antitoxin system RelE family toxin [Mycobacterium sp. THU-M104]|uniref:type II toxin-antitoxin system RelE family toxin n=1 Tax=Mycobacterium sp. THU-M104 TaxID=3410515 RepID=UPI003B9988CC